MKVTLRAGIVSALLVAGFAFGVPAGAAPSHMAASASLKCPSCGMPMPTKKSAMMTVPINVKAKHGVYYCCPMCPSGKAGAAYMKKHHKPMSV